ncbi:nuclear receptor subfamily 5 group A member 2-like isoform X1 [Pecten maximus]|uniref:nuclear receptor subfamily 5 group A member 2-like isoform X1 n=1 Tax=Pecten maximus TaxID=6579 RepID=UPI001458C592|nr:nuclear receptor subfamily 5 group A member 2-like isoform X1 [Pecten maximus]
MIQHMEKSEFDSQLQSNTSNSEHGSNSSQGEGNDEASTSVNEMQYPPDVKSGFDELCPVCGDKVSGYHYGLLTCESCKGFFKRTVQNKKVYSCVDNRSCHIDKSQRKRCPFCRFQKCLSVGMKLEAVRQDRMRGGRNKFGPMYKRDRALKQQVARQQHHLMASCGMHLMNGMAPLPPSSEDIKPDPAILQQMAASINANMGGYGMNHSPLSGMPSPAMPDSPPTDLSRVSGMSQHSPVSSPPGHYSSLSQQTYPSMMTALRNNYSPSQHHSQHHPHSHHQPIHPPHHHQHHHSQQPHHHQMSPMAAAPPIVPIVPQLIIDMKANLTDENEICQKLFSFVQTQYGHEDVVNQPLKLLQMICKLSDQLLFLMVEWARTSVYFKEFKVEDQMKMLQHSWSEILILDLVHRLVREIWSGEVTLESGQKLALDCLDKLGLADAKDRIRDLIRKMRDLKIDVNEYLCLKYLILLNPDVPGLENRHHVEQCQERVNAALMEYCVNFYPSVKDKFGQVLLRLPEVRLISIRAEEFLYFKHLNGELPEQTLLIEMLHSKKK